MSLSSAISNAMSGLRAASTAADITGSNLANATNENYARREIAIEANSSGGVGGVRVVGIQRHTNAVITTAWRDANGEATMARQQAADAAAIQGLYGDPTQPGSLANRLARFEQSLVSASARPELTERLTHSAMSLKELVGAINDIGDGIQRQRQAADREIAHLSTRMAEILTDMEKIHVRMTESMSQGKDLSAFLDRRDQLLDELSGITDIRVYPRDFDRVAIYATGSSVLLDSSAADFAFERSTVMTADMSVSDGQLGALHIDGEPITSGAVSGKLRGGRLGALFEFRDVTAVAKQAEIDSFALELATRLNDPDLDPTRTTSNPGFLTADGGPVDPADITGLANRLRLHDNLDPAGGGDPRFLRDGLQAAAEGAPGNAALLNGLAGALSARSAVAQGPWAGQTLSLDGFAVQLTSTAAYALTRSEDAEAFAAAQSETLRAYKLEDAVDSDAELQKLMLLEQAYAANAQVIRSVDEMMDTLLGLV